MFIRTSNMRHLLRLPLTRAFSSATLNVDKNLLSKLRKQTGIPFINCKKALTKFDNDFEQAKQWLISEAQREGWTRATKLQSRPMSQGLVALLADSRQAAMIEVNCETDFVAKNEKFVAMITSLVEDCSNYFKGTSESEISLSAIELGEIRSSCGESSLADTVALMVGALGENMALRRGIFLQASPSNLLCSYVHPSGGSGPRRLMLGKYGAVVELVPPASSPSPGELEGLGRELCQHIVGMNPVRVGEPTTDTTDTDSHGSEKGEDGALLSQEFLLESGVTVHEVLESRGGGASVARFSRFACGEELPGEDK